MTKDKLRKITTTLEMTLKITIQAIMIPMIKKIMMGIILTTIQANTKKFLKVILTRTLTTSIKIRYYHLQVYLLTLY